MKHDPMKIPIIMILVMLALPIFAVRAENPQAILNQYMSELQKNPDDYALREKIIRHVQTMKPAPAVPDEARRFMNRGMAAAEGAKTESDYRDAIQEFQKAVNSRALAGQRRTATLRSCRTRRASTHRRCRT